MRKFLQPLLIGELAPEEPSQDGPQNVSGAPVEAKPPVRGPGGAGSTAGSNAIHITPGGDPGPGLGLPSLPGQQPKVEL